MFSSEESQNYQADSSSALMEVTRLPLFCHYVQTRLIWEINVPLKLGLSIFIIWSWCWMDICSRRILFPFSWKNGSLTRERIRDESAGGSWDLFNQLLDSTPRGNFGNLGKVLLVEKIIAFQTMILASSTLKQSWLWILDASTHLAWTLNEKAYDFYF